ncbi:hypothetical protein LXL04_037972 [Taraxacum kok-saghyz]
MLPYVICCRLNAGVSLRFANDHSSFNVGINRLTCKQTRSERLRSRQQRLLLFNQLPIQPCFGWIPSFFCRRCFQENSILDFLCWHPSQPSANELVFEKPQPKPPRST